MLDYALLLDDTSSLTKRCPGMRSGLKCRLHSEYAWPRPNPVAVKTGHARPVDSQRKKRGRCICRHTPEEDDRGDHARSEADAALYDRIRQAEVPLSASC